MTSSRILKRNRGMVRDEIGEVEYIVLPQSCSPLNPAWRWPTWVNTPYRYAFYVERLHKCSGLDMVFPRGVFLKFASANKRLGYERLTRAAALAASRTQHPFSPKHIKRYLEFVPSREVLSVVLY